MSIQALLSHLQNSISLLRIDVHVSTRAIEDRNKNFAILMITWVLVTNNLCLPFAFLQGLDILIGLL